VALVKIDVVGQRFEVQGSRIASMETAASGIPSTNTLVVRAQAAATGRNNGLAQGKDWRLF